MADERLVETIFALIRDALENVHTATIARVEAVNGSTVDLQPVVSRRVRGEERDLPLLRSVPVFTLQGGGSYSAPPVQAGDYAVALIMERCFDRWWDGQDGRPPLEDRMHDYSDAVALVGLNPLAGAVTVPDVWTEMGDRYHEGDREHVGNETHEGDRDQIGNQTITGDLEVTGNVTVTGDLTVGGVVSAGGFAGAGGQPAQFEGALEADEVTASGVSLTTHTHTDSDGGTTSPPN